MTGSTLDFVPAPAQGVESCPLDGELLLWREARLHRLDALGALVWECFDGEATLGEIGRRLAETFGAPERDVHHDLSELCEELFDVGLLEGGTPEAVDPLPFVQMGWPPSVPLDPDLELRYSTGRFRAVDHDFAVRSNDPRLVDHLDRLLRSFAAPGAPARWYSVVTTAETEQHYRVYLDDEGLVARPDADGVLRYVLWHVNYAVITGSARHLLVHGGGATMGERAVALPGDMNAGKTTLVAGLALDGLGFLTDEIVALNLTTGLVDPYPRPLNIGRGSWEVLPRLRPADWQESEPPLPDSIWHVEPTTIRPDVVAQPAVLAWVIAPRFEEGAPTTLEPLSRAEGAALLHRHAFNRHRFGASGIRAAVAAATRARCARLVSGDLTGAVKAVRRFMEENDPG